GFTDGHGQPMDVHGWTIHPHGGIHVTLSDSAALIIRGTVLLVDFADPEKLAGHPGSLFSGSEAAGITAPLRPGTGNVGEIRSGSVDVRTFDELSLARRNA